MVNPLLNDRDVAFVLHEVLDVGALTDLEYFADHSRETFDAVVDAARRVAREVLFPGYRVLDERPPRFVDGAVQAAPELRAMLARMAELGLVNAARPYGVGGQQVPMVVMAAANAYLMAANLSAFGYVGLTAGAGHLIEAFGDEHLRATFLEPMYSGAWTGTMALTEPHAGSSLGDLTTSATPLEDGTWAVRGAKVFISGGDHDLTDNIVHLVLARIAGAPEGTRGISLFAVPKRRPDGEALVDNDVRVTGVIHKIGWRGLPSLALSFGEAGDCRGWLVGEAGRGLAQMFQMMNEARLMVGLNGVATAAVAYQEALAYARERPQGRHPGQRGPQVAIIEHADVRRMLLRQKAIVDGGLTLLLATSLQADRAAHAATAEERARAQRLLDLLTPIAKTFPAEAGFEANALAVQVHGGYGYSSEYLPESWLRDQKLNSIHEGTTGIQGIDLLGRRALAGGGAALAEFAEAVAATLQRAERAGLDGAWATDLAQPALSLGQSRLPPGRSLGHPMGDLDGAVHELAALTAELGAIGAAGDAQRMLRHSADYLDLFSVVAVAWQHLERAAAAAECLTAGRGHEPHLRGVSATTAYWFATELPRTPALVARIRSGEDSYAALDPAGF